MVCGSGRSGSSGVIGGSLGVGGVAVGVGLGVPTGGVLVAA